MDINNLMTVKQAADMLGRSISSVRVHVRKGHIPATRGPDGNWFISKDTVETLKTHWPWRAGNPQVRQLRASTLARQTAPATRRRAVRA